MADEPTADLDDTDDAILTRARAAARLRLKQKDSESVYATDPWRFLTECVWTIDQQSGEIRQFPARGYLQYLTREWQEHRLLLVPKSRRMMVTWWAVALHYWLLRWRPNTTIAFQSKKEGRTDAEGSAELVERAKFIHDHLPASVAKIPCESKFCYFGFPTQHSEIIGIGQGPDQLRQLTVTAIFADELAFWVDARDTFIAARPTIEGGGRFLGVSSANPGFFQQLMTDNVNLQM